MEFRKEMLDKRVCDVFGALPIKSTFRQIINQMEAILNETPENIDNMTTEEINEYATNLNKRAWGNYCEDDFDE